MNKVIKFLGIPLGKEFIKNEVYRKRILFHEIKLNFNEYHITYRFLGIKYKTVTFSFVETFYNYFNIIKYSKKDSGELKIIVPLLIYYLKEKLQTDAFDVIGIFSHSGEVFLSMYHMKEYFEKNNISNPVFITQRLTNTNIIKMFFPEIPSIAIPNIFMGIYNQNIPPTKFGNCSIRLFLTQQHFCDFENSLNKGEDKHFYYEMKNSMNVSSNLTAFPQISEKDKKSAETKMKLIGLKKPFIYISPNSFSTKTFCNDFWDNLHVGIYNLRYKMNGKEYDVFYNSIPSKSQNTYYKSCSLSFSEARYIASQADIIIGVRSGLMDIISNNTSKIFCMYFQFYKRWKFLWDLDAGKSITGYSLKKIPNINPDNIFEYNTSEMTQEEIIYDILNKISD